MTKSIMPIDTDFLTMTQQFQKINLLLGFSELKFPHQKCQILFYFTNGQIIVLELTWRENKFSILKKMVCIILLLFL